MPVQEISHEMCPENELTERGVDFDDLKCTSKGSSGFLHKHPANCTSKFTSVFNLKLLLNLDVNVAGARN